MLRSPQHDCNQTPIIYEINKHNTLYPSRRTNLELVDGSFKKEEDAGKAVEVIGIHDGPGVHILQDERWC